MTSDRLRSLVVVPEPPLKEGRGSGRLVLAMAHGLAAHGVDVRLLAARQAFAIPGRPPDDVDLEVIDVPPEPVGWRSRVRRLRRPVGEIARSGVGPRVREATQEADILHLEEIGTAWCSEGATIPALLRLHYLVRWDRSFGPPWRRDFRHALEFELAERAAIRRHDYFAAASPQIAAELRRRKPSAEVEVAPFCLDPNDYPPAALEGPPVAGLIGMGTWSPTRYAIERLLQDVWPEVRRRLPEAKLVIAGRGTEDLFDRSVPGVEMRGEVVSTADFFHELSLLLYPLERGSGVKVKTLESIAFGVPVVTTPLGAEGIEAGDGVVVGETMKELVDAAVAILRDAGERRQRGTAARQAFLQRYSPRPATEPLAAMYRRLAEANG
jgi:glycosyltransferase involved in cell wall biosynthesis